MQLSRATHQHRAMLRYQVADDLEVLDTLRAAAYGGQPAPHGSGVDTDECIFIIGLFRSGTTLVSEVAPHLSSGSSVQIRKDGLPKLKDFPKEMGGSGAAGLRRLTSPRIAAYSRGEMILQKFRRVSD